MYNTVNPDDIKLHGNATFPKWVPVRERFTSLSYERGQAFLFSLKTHSKVARLYMGSRQWRCSQSSLIDGHECTLWRMRSFRTALQKSFSCPWSRRKTSRADWKPIQRIESCSPPRFSPFHEGFLSILGLVILVSFLHFVGKLFSSGKDEDSLSRDIVRGRGEGIIEPISSYSRNYFQTEDYIFSLVVFNVEKILKILLAP